MLGALVGDVIGSFWESTFNKNPNVPLWMPGSRFTDDSVCTGAIASWLIDNKPLVRELQMRGRAHCSAGFGGNMLAWILSPQPKPYESWGNGSAMRVSPVALWARDDDHLMALARESAAPTHNSPEAINGAQAAAWAMRKALEGWQGEAILAEVQTRFGYAGLVERDPVSERPGHTFDITCAGTVPLALAIAVRSGSFDTAMQWCCSMGGDADTLAAIAGPVCEALYGIPRQHLDNAIMRFLPNDDIWEPVARIYQHPDVAARLKHWGKTDMVIAATGDEHVVPHWDLM